MAVASLPTQLEARHRVANQDVIAGGKYNFDTRTYVSSNDEPRNHEDGGMYGLPDFLHIHTAHNTSGLASYPNQRYLCVGTDRSPSSRAGGSDMYDDDPCRGLIGPARRVSRWPPWDGIGPAHAHQPLHSAHPSIRRAMGCAHPSCRSRPSFT